MGQKQECQGVLKRPIPPRVQGRLCLEYLKDCTCTNSFADDLVATCDEILDTAETTSVNPIDKTNY